MHKVLLAMTEQLVRKVQQDFKVLRVTLVQPALSGRQALKALQDFKELQAMLAQQVL